MALYPYTLQPVSLNLTEAEFHQAQYELFSSAQPSFGLKGIKVKEWVIIAIVIVLAIAGLLMVSGYSTIIFWLMLVAVVIYLGMRTIGFKWYVTKEFDKQIAAQEMPEEMRGLKLGVQKHGLVLAMPVNQAELIENPKHRGIQMRAAPTQQSVIPWSAVTSWDETPDYLFVMFELKGQKGSQIIPKRLEAQNFPIASVLDHLKEVVPVQGLNLEAIKE